MSKEDIEARLKDLQQDVELMALALESLSRSLRANARMGELSIEMEAIHTSLNDLEPDLDECFTAIRCQEAEESPEVGVSFPAGKRSG
jgi:hypothetical protein